MTKLKQVGLSQIIVMNGLGNITNSTTISQSCVHEGDQTLVHTQAFILTHNVRIICINVIIVHESLDVEECDRSVDVDADFDE